MARSSASESSLSHHTSEDFEESPKRNQPIFPSTPTITSKIPRPTNPINMSPSKTYTGVYYLPVPGSKNAPKKFTGKFSEIKLFIKHYEKLCIQKKVTDPGDKVENITQYCSRKVREFMEGLPSYAYKDWDLFVHTSALQHYL